MIKYWTCSEYTSMEQYERCSCMFFDLECVFLIGQRLLKSHFNVFFSFPLKFIIIFEFTVILIIFHIFHKLGYKNVYCPFLWRNDHIWSQSREFLLHQFESTFTCIHFIRSIYAFKWPNLNLDCRKFFDQCFWRRFRKFIFEIHKSCTSQLLNLGSQWIKTFFFRTMHEMSFYAFSMSPFGVKRMQSILSVFLVELIVTNEGALKR